jgi:hypothetical protein
MVHKPRPHELALEFGITSREVIAKLRDMGVFIKSASSTIEPPVAQRLRDTYARSGQVLHTNDRGRPRSADSQPLGAPNELKRRLTRLVADNEMVDLLVERVAQTEAAEAAGAHQLAVVSAVSVVEGLLSAQLPEPRSTLEALIETAYETGLIQLDARTFLHAVRSLRNLIHPTRQLSENGFAPDRDTLVLCWATVRTVLNDLERTRSAGH